MFARSARRILLYSEIMRVISNPNFSKRRTVRVSFKRALVSAFWRMAAKFFSAWQLVFPMPRGPDGPGHPPAVASEAALREGALLKENVEAVSRKSAA